MAKRKPKEEYNWIDDPFDPEKQAEDMKRMQQSSGCAAGTAGLMLLVAVILIVIAVMLIGGLLDIAGTR